MSNTSQTVQPQKMPIETNMEEELGINDKPDTNQIETNHFKDEISKTKDLDAGTLDDAEMGKVDEPAISEEDKTDRVLNGESQDIIDAVEDKSELTNEIDTLTDNMNKDVEKNQDHSDTIQTETKTNLNSQMDVDEEDKEEHDITETNIDSVNNAEENHVEETATSQEKSSSEVLEQTDDITNASAIPDNDNNDNMVDADNDDDLDLNEPCSNTENEQITNLGSQETNEQNTKDISSNPNGEDDAVDSTEHSENIDELGTMEDVPNTVEGSVNDKSTDEPFPSEEESTSKPDEIIDTGFGGDSSAGLKDTKIEDEDDNNKSVENEINIDDEDGIIDTSNDIEQQENDTASKTEEIHEDSFLDKGTDEVAESADSFEVTENEHSVLDDSSSTDFLVSSEDKANLTESIQSSVPDNSDSCEKVEVSENLDELQDQEMESEQNEFENDESVKEETAGGMQEKATTVGEVKEDISQNQTSESSETLTENTNSLTRDTETTKLNEEKNILEENQDGPVSEVPVSVAESSSEENSSIDKTVPDDANEIKEIPSESESERNNDESNETKSEEKEDKNDTNEGEEAMETEDIVESAHEDSSKLSEITENGKIDVKEEDTSKVPSQQLIEIDENTSKSAEIMDTEDSNKTGEVQVDKEAMEVTETSPTNHDGDKTNDSNKTSDTPSSEKVTVGEVKKEIEEKTDASSGLKIDSVMSAESQQDNKLNDSGLELKIDSVSGAGDTTHKSEEMSKEESKPVTIKTEKIDPDTVEKKPSAKQSKTDTKKPADDDDDDVIAIKEEKKLPPPKPKSSKIQKCIVCAKVGKCKYNIVRNGDVKHLCDDKCFKQFRSDPTSFLKQAEKEKEQQKEVSTKMAAKEPLKPASTNLKNVMASAKPKNVGGELYKTCTVCQLMNIKTSKPFLNWQGLDYCGEECLGKFQGNLSVTCTYCSSQIHQTNKAKFCARIGSEVKHFCSQTCNTEYVKRIKVCAFCNKDLAKENNSFMAPVGNQGMFKDFCSQACLLKYEDKHSKDVEVTGDMVQGTKTAVAPKGNFTCAVCSKSGPIKHELKLENKLHRLCSDPCFSAFQYANKLTLNCCDSCGTPCNQSNDAPHFVQFEGKQKRFCSFMCVNQFRNQKRKLTPCAWCGNKKSNFDMIERVDSNNKFQLFCSLNCLSLYRVNLQATSNQAVICDQCQKFVPAQYHLTMSDASVRNFCSYGCVMQFQAQFQTPTTPKQPAQNNTQKQIQTTTPPVTTTRSGRVVKGGAKQQQYMDTQQPRKETTKQTNKANQNQDSFPIISNVVSLAPKGNQQQINIRSAGNVTVTDQQSGKTITTSTGNQTVQQQIIIQPPPPKSVKNKSLLCKPFVQTKATACRPHTQTKEVQTEGKPEPDKIFVPIPVPIYCPTPLSMYTMPAPILVPIPVPVPVPVFIPTTKKNSASILKQIKEIQEKIPADPLEAELLMMAEAVAGKGEESSSDSEDGEVEAPPSKEETPATTGGVLGEDMLQMALRMASEMSDEPVMDLETSLEPVAVNTEPPQPIPPPAPPQVKDEDTDDEEYIPTTRARRGRGASKRQTRSAPRRSNKRQKTETIPQPQYHTPTPSPPAPQAPPPDANFHLKYTYGVNAFKYWVTQKNSQLEDAGKSGHSRSLKTFKTDILQCTADELNYALCLFVKEVRKPNTEEYAVDSIYYLCLGIQQYLFENGRIDNVFTDMYYERFTECLNELLCKYEPKLNPAGQLVCRIEEEHLWESKQLGAHSPHVLLNTLVYFNTKYFMLKTSEDHLKLSFTHIMKHWKKTASGRGSGVGVNAGRSVYLRYYCPTPQNKDNNSKKKKEEMPVYEQTENLDNPLRCPVKLYEFYLSKCPESIKNRNDTFYLIPERSCVPDSPVWYSTAMLGIDAMAKMLNRIRLVREIQEAHLHTQPIYI